MGRQARQEALRADESFPVRGETPESRRKKIGKVFQLSPMAGFLLSAVNLEWTIRRAILALGWDSTRSIRKQFETHYGLDAYKTMWKQQVVFRSPSPRPDLVRLVEQHSATNDPDGLVYWPDVKRAFRVRNTIVHGCSCTAGENYLYHQTFVFLRMSEILISFVAENGGNVFKTIRRINPHCPSRRRV